MARISLAEADALVGKLSSERIRVEGYFKSSSGSETRISGFVEYQAPKDEVFARPGDPTARSLVRNELIVSTPGSSLVPGQGYLSLRPFHSGCEIWYGEAGELPEEQKHLTDKFGDSALSLCFTFPESNECFALFFTI
ncbi:MAG TPA: hypothetical protein VJR26_05210 [Candidatus Acidoferrales bacterium]|nr:hypothetical protein [Candidatus Acidoferrales bacterium]